MIIKNYFVIALRHFWRNRLFALINIFSLAVGISASMLLFMYLRSEWRYDAHHQKADRIFRVPLEIKTESAIDRMAQNNFLFAPTLQAHFPQEIENYFRILPIGKQPVKVGERIFNEEKVVFTDQSFLDILDLPWAAGKKKNALRDSLTVVLNEATAIRYFGSAENAIGKQIKFPVKRYTVTGVLKDDLLETNFRYDLYLSAVSINKIFIEQCKVDMLWLTTYNFLLLRKGITAQNFEQKINLPESLDKYSIAWQTGKPAKIQINYFLQSIKNIHLDMSFQGEYFIPTNALYLYILSFIGGFILLMACINYMNLATARAGQRAKEVGLRKVLGASRFQLLAQFLGESFVLACVSILLGLAIAEILLPNFNYLTDKKFTQLPWWDIEFWGMSSTIILIISILAGLYPAIYLSSFPPTWVLQDKTKGTWHIGRIWLNPSNLRKGLVILQFALSISMMIGTLIAYSQWDYMRTQPLGFQKDNIMVIDIPVGDTLLITRLPLIENRLRKNREVVGTSLTSTVMDGRFAKLEHFIYENNHLSVQTFNVLSIDDKWLPLMEVPLKEGKNFSPIHPDSMQAVVIVNETLVKKMGWVNPIGKKIGNGFMHYDKYKQQDTLFCEVIGVVKDFHYESLQKTIEPLLLYYMPKTTGFMFVKIKPENAEKTEAWVRQEWQEVDKTHPIETFSLAKHIESRYEPQGKLVTIFGYFSLLAIIISGLGLLGLTSYLTEQRAKEIGIRRVLGASAGEVVRQFAVEFVWLVAFAFLLASPVVYTLMLRWLKEFAYRAQPSASHFLLAGFSALFIAVATVSWLTWRVAKRKPSLALRHGG
jgi:putative ABC transport system permease protein